MVADVALPEVAAARAGGPARKPPPRPRPARAAHGARLALVAAHLVLALFAPIIAPHSISAILTTGLTPPSPEHWLGTDQIGRDYLSRLMAGGRVALLVALSGVSVAVAVGAVLGLVAGYVGGLARRRDHAPERRPDVGARAAADRHPGPDLRQGDLVALDRRGDRLHARRRAGGGGAATITVSALDFVRAAELRGESTAFVLLREIAPNLLGILAVEFAIRCSSAVLKISALSFLGLGISQPTPDWGLMVQEAMSVVVHRSVVL